MERRQFTFCLGMGDDNKPKKYINQRFRRKPRRGEHFSRYWWSALTPDLKGLWYKCEQ